MRVILALLCAVMAIATVDTARADPYRWCAVYSGGGMFGGGGGKNCGFVTLAQCRATISGIGGRCEPNPFYDGRPVVTPEERAAPRRRARPR